MEMPGIREGFVKKVVCHACGAPKVNRSATAFVYCDFCGVLTDWDFQIAIADPESKLPGPAYDALTKRLAADLASAASTKDRDAYLALQRRIFDAYVSACPAACPPRCREPVYRVAYVEYSAEMATISAFDPESAKRSAAVDESVRALEWKTTNASTKVTAESFWRMYDAIAASIGPVDGGGEPAGSSLAHPDGASPALLRKMSMSMLAQAWIPYLAEGDAKQLLARTGLAAEYVQAPAVERHPSTCGNCGKPIAVPEGARRFVCEGCGHVVGAGGRGGVPCTGCGAVLAMPEGKNAFACTFCKTELRAMRW